MNEALEIKIHPPGLIEKVYKWSVTYKDKMKCGSALTKEEAEEKVKEAKEFLINTYK